MAKFVVGVMGPGGGAREENERRVNDGTSNDPCGRWSPVCPSLAGHDGWHGQRLDHLFGCDLARHEGP